MLAVLPFDNLTGDAGQDYFSDGLTEEMISQLGNLDPAHLGVIARTSVMHYKHSQEPLDRIGKQLGVQYVLEGSVRRDSDKVRITAQLIQVKDQSHIWARQYDRDLSSLLALQDEIARAIAGEIELTLGGHQRNDLASNRASISREDYVAYDLYLKGRYFWNKRSTVAFQQAIEYFKQAIARDPGNARAYAGLADSYTLLSGYSVTPQAGTMPKARAAALKALELDDRLAEAHTSLALITENYDWNWQAAEKEYRRAIELDPNYATAHQWYAEFLALQGRFDEAFAESERARQLDPLSLIIAADNGMILFYSRQYDRAIAQFRAVQEMEPDFGRAHMVAGAYVENGQYSDAIAEVEKTKELDRGAWFWSWRAYVYGRAGQPLPARQSLEQLQKLYRAKDSGPDAILWAYIGMGDRESSFVWLEKAYADHSNSLTGLKVNPGYDALRGDPRFQDLMRRVNLIQ
jgi:TolB-like protein/Tfp pilus assembly protein PilF